MSLPPLQPVPHLERLLAPGEEIIYTARFSPLRGGWWLFSALVFLGLFMVFRHIALVVPTCFCFFIWALPFHTNEIAVTNLRLLFRLGDFRLRMEGIPSERVESWRVRQTLIGSFLHHGNVTIVVKEGRELRYIDIAKVRNPMTFLEALETLQRELQPEVITEKAST